MAHTSHLSNNLLWDVFCATSIIGIWPRWIEPRWIRITRLNLPISNLPRALHGFKILQFSDLHFSEQTANSFLNKLTSSIQSLTPDLIAFTGDFLCYSQLQDEIRLKNFLKNCRAPYGCYAVLGNHDYTQYVSVNDAGDYDIIPHTHTSIKHAFKRLLVDTVLTRAMTSDVQDIGYPTALHDILADASFHILHNTSTLIHVKDASLNLLGCGEYTVGHFKPDTAFSNYDNTHPGILLVHNPDAVPHLKNYPGDIVLCGHTHGAQINLPWIWKKFTLLENNDLKRGLIYRDKKWIYVNRGIGSIIPFRWFSPPELLLLTLVPL